jgi:hypothetical protein
VEDWKLSEIKLFTIFSRDLTRGSGATGMARNLEKDFKKGDGKLLREFEEKSGVDPLECKDPDQVQTWYDSRLKGRTLHRKFYYSKRYIKKKRQYTYKKRRYYDSGRNIPLLRPQGDQ